MKKQQTTSNLSTKTRLIKRLDGYYKLEGFNAIWIFTASLFVLYQQKWHDVLWFTYGIWLMVYILVQGTWYWKLKLHVLQGKSIPQAKELARFRRFKQHNIVLIALIPVVLGLQYYIVPDFSMKRYLLYTSIFVNVFAVLEHINYYSHQLMYDNPYDWKYLWRNKRLKQASLWKDLRDGRM